MSRNENEYDPRKELLQLLLDKIDDDPYPSSTMMDLVEQMLTPDDRQGYAEILLAKIRADQFPSLDLMDRVRSLA